MLQEGKLEAIARKREGAITKSAATPASMGLKARQLRRSPIALGAIGDRLQPVVPPPGSPTSPPPSVSQPPPVPPPPPPPPIVIDKP